MNPVHIHSTPPLPDHIPNSEILVQSLGYQPAGAERIDGESIRGSVRLLDGLRSLVDKIPANMVFAEGSRLAKPLKIRKPRDSIPESGVINRNIRTKRKESKDAVRMLGLDPREPSADGAVRELRRRRRVGSLDSEEGIEVGVGERVEEARVPAKGGGGDGSGSDGVADVVVAVAEGTLAILPGFAPEDGREGEEEGVGNEGRREEGAELEGVILGGVMGNERGMRRGKGGGNEVGFGGMEVAAGGVDTEGPGRKGGGFPGGEGEGVEEEIRKGKDGEGEGWGWKGGREEKRIVRRRRRRRRMRKRDGWRGEEAEERVWLVGPIEVVRSGGVGRWV